MATTVDLDNSLDDEEISTINIIPFVDVVLVLLVIFMVTSTAIARASLQVELPKAASAGAGVESTLNIVLTNDDTLLLNGEQVTPAELAAFVRGEAKAHPKLQAVIAADTSSRYGAVIAVIDLIKTHGVSSFALNIERDAGKATAHRAGE